MIRAYFYRGRHRRRSFWVGHQVVGLTLFYAAYLR